MTELITYVVEKMVSICNNPFGFLSRLKFKLRGHLEALEYLGVSVLSAGIFKIIKVEIVML